MSITTTSRTLSLLGLLESRATWPAAELAERLGVTTRTVRNDVQRLRELGYPVDAQAGRGGGYRLGAGAALPPLLLDDDEAVALVVSLRTAAGGGTGRIEEGALRALGKIDQVLPARLRRRVRGLGEAMSAAGTGAPAVDPDLLVAISAACRDREGLRFAYANHGGRTGRRSVEPHHLVHLGRFWYLVAWDLDRDDWRTFRLDRLAGPPRPGRRFTARPAPPGGFTAHVARGRLAPNRWHAEVVLHGSLAELREKIPPRYGTLEQLDPDCCLLITASDWLGGLAVNLALLDVEFEVRSPPELIAEVDKLADRFDRARKRAADPDVSSGAERPSDARPK